MKKTMKLSLLGCLALLVCALMLTACDNGNEPQTPSGTTDGTTEPGTEAHVHSFGEWTTVKEATCTEKGEQERVCVCSEKETQSIDMIAHAEVIDDAVAPTCTATGLTEGKHCSICNAVIVPQQAVSMIPHTYDDKYDEECNVCGYKRDAECAHLETEIIKGEDATCTETGLTDGVKCKKCGEILTAQTTIPAKGHTEVIDKAVASTCTETGLTEGKRCSVCNFIIEKQHML